MLGAMLMRVTNHDYLGVTVLSDLNWLRHVIFLKLRLAEPMVYLDEPSSPARKM